MKRGELYVAAPPGDYGKPRPVLILQNDGMSALESKIVCLLTTFDEPLAFLRLRVEPSPQNGLTQTSFVMVEKIVTLPVWRIRQRIGELEATLMPILNARLSVVLGLA